MSNLVLHSTQDADRQIALDRERITIGRKAHNDIQLDTPAVSSNHAVIITLGSDSFLEDLHSTNGTQVNQKTVHKCVLQDGDEIQIANFRFTFFSRPAAQSAPGKTISTTPKREAAPHAEHPTMAMQVLTDMPEATHRVSPVAQEEIPTDTHDAREIPPGNGTLGIIRIVSGPGSGQELVLSRPTTTLGKPGMQVVAITLRDGLYFLGIIEGEELPRINGGEIKTLPYLLQQGDTIDIAGIQLKFTLR